MLHSTGPHSNTYHPPGANTSRGTLPQNVPSSCSFSVLRKERMQQHMQYCTQLNATRRLCPSAPPILQVPPAPRAFHSCCCAASVPAGLPPEPLTPAGPHAVPAHQHGLPTRGGATAGTGDAAAGRACLCSSELQSSPAEVSACCLSGRQLIYASLHAPCPSHRRPKSQPP